MSPVSPGASPARAYQLGTPYRLDRAPAEPTTSEAPATDEWDAQSNLATSTLRLSDNLETQNAATRLQQQDGTLRRTAALVARMDELKSLHADPATADEDRATYEAEFAELQTDLTSYATESIDGQALFTAAPGASMPAGGAAAGAFRDDFTTADQWESLTGELSVGDNTFYPSSGYSGSVQTKQSFRGSMEITFDLYLPGTNDSLDIAVGDAQLSSLTDGVNLEKWQWHSVRIAYDGTGNAATYVDGSDEAVDTRSGLAEASGQLSLANLGLGSARIRDFAVTPGAGAGAIAASQLDSLASVATLDELDTASIDDAAQQLAALQEANTAALDELTTAAESMKTSDETEGGIADASEAEEVTALTRQEILRNGADSLLAQSNLDSDTVLALIA